jgi:hypothetical protein
MCPARIDTATHRTDDRAVLCRLGLVTILVVVCAGCSSEQRETDSSTVATAFLTAMTDGDTRAACALLATDTREGLESSEGKPCAASLESLDITGGTIDATDVWGDRAQARAATGTVFLVELNDGWRVTAAGCTRSADGPYECLLAA